MRYQPRLVQPVRTPAVEPDEVADPVANVWRIWVQATSRTSDKELTDDYRAMISTTLEENEWVSQTDFILERAVRAAAYLPPVIGDDNDILRLISALSSEEARELALEELKSVTSLPFLFEEISELLGLYNKIITVLGIEDNEDNRMIVWEITEYPEDLLHGVCENLRSEDEPITPTAVLGRLKETNSSLFPVTSKENRSRGPQKKESGADVAYKSARNVDEVSVLVRNDLQGRDMVKSGYPVKVIVAHHNDVPVGYWERVDEEIVKPDSGDLMDVYDVLEKEFNFHAEDREVPTRD